MERKAISSGFHVADRGTDDGIERSLCPESATAGESAAADALQARGDRGTGCADPPVYGLGTLPGTDLLDLPAGDRARRTLGQGQSERQGRCRGEGRAGPD